ncbi:MAG TPA: ATP-dependent protease LonB, partial [Candidatus Paenibacillus intestinavium]|nr:ATP-dependent protease LonB [Candidatus Paenibacillus intestinavium]
NWQEIFADLNGLQVIPVSRIEEVLSHVFPELAQWNDEDQTEQWKLNLFSAPTYPYLQAESYE